MGGKLCGIVFRKQCIYNFRLDWATCNTLRTYAQMSNATDCVNFS